LTDTALLRGQTYSAAGAQPPSREEQGSYKGAGVIGQQHKQKWKNKLEQFIQSFPDQISIGTMAIAFKMSFLIYPLQK